MGLVTSALVSAMCGGEHWARLIPVGKLTPAHSAGAPTARELWVAPGWWVDSLLTYNSQNCLFQHILCRNLGVQVETVQRGTLLLIREVQHVELHTCPDFCSPTGSFSISGCPTLTRIHCTLSPLPISLTISLHSGLCKEWFMQQWVAPYDKQCKSNSIHKSYQCTGIWG